MLTPEQVRAVDLGRLDAESDPRLLEYFLVTGTAAKARTDAKLIVGRKGSGKTALFRHLQDTLSASSTVVNLDLDQYVFGVHKKLVDAGLPPTRAYASSWKMLIYAAMFGAIRDQLSDGERSDGDKALAKMGDSENDGRFKAILRWLKRLRRIEAPSVMGTGGGAMELGPKAGGPLSDTSIDGLDQLEEVLKRVVKAHPVTVLIDRLDDAWDGSDASRLLITGAVQATRDVAIGLGQPHPVPVITFLRTDLWEKVSANDRNKMSQDTLYLDWTTDQLVKIIDLRIASSLTTTSGSPNWSDLFTSEEMRQRARARTYIAKRTMNRPRDMLAFAIFAQAAAVSAGHSRIEAGDIYEAEKAYSRHMLEELRDEIEQHVADYPATISSLKALRKRNFTFDNWLTACRANGLDDVKAREALTQLFEASAVGMHASGGARGGSATKYRYQDRHLASRNDALHQVHQALVQELGLKDA